MTENNEPLIFYTSGSTGEPKVIKKSYEAVYKEALDMADCFNISKDTVIVSTVSPEHMFGATFMIMLPKVCGCFVEPERVFYPEDLKDYGKYIFITTPSFMEKLAKYNFMFKYPPLMIIAAGAKLQNDVYEYFEKMCPVTEIYGSTETGVMAYRKSSKDNLRFFDNVKYENGKIKSPYFDEPELPLCDGLEFLDDGFIVKGRNDRIVKIQEKRVSLNEIENILNKNELVEKSYCLEIGDKLCAAVVLKSRGCNILREKGKLELIKILKDYAKSEGFPVRCKRWRFLFDLPVNDRGKIDERRIREVFSTNLTYPNVITSSVKPDYAEFLLIFPHESNFFKGHFTNFPILPGVVQLFFVKEFIKDSFGIDFIPEKIKKIKFSSVIKPDVCVCLGLVKKENSVDFKFFDGDKIFSSGTFVL